MPARRALWLLGAYDELYKIDNMKMHAPLQISSPPHVSLPETVYRELREAILNGIFRPGQMLRQEEIAKRLGVSRAPLREALPRLEAEGIVVLHPRRGYAVASLDPAEIAEIFELRTLVEERAAYLATLQRTDADVAPLRELVARMGEIQPGDPEQIARWADLNFQFHDNLFAPSGRRHYLRVAGSLRASVEPYIRVELGITGEMEEAQGEHEQLLEAFAAGDAERVARLSREHCEHTLARLLAGLRRTSDTGGEGGR
jgi:DNA-binding GntR family transcriptional regulator